jgi:hypothetical protein
MRPRAVIAGALFWACTRACLAASPAPDPDVILRQAFDHYRAGTSESRVVMTIHRTDWERRLELTADTHGHDDALVRFTAPAKDAGSATLQLAGETWVFNPRLNQVIRLPQSMLSRSWMGSDFSYSDLAKSEDLLTLYTHRLTATRLDEGHAVWTIEATPRPGAAVVWGKVAVMVRDDWVIVEETFFDQDFKAARRMTTDKIGRLDGRPYPVSMTMQPLDQPGQWTRVETQEAHFDIPLPGWVFTLSNLQTPRR